MATMSATTEASPAILSLIESSFPKMAKTISSYIADYFKDTSVASFGADGRALRDFLAPLLQDAPADMTKAEQVLEQIMQMALPAPVEGQAPPAEETSVGLLADDASEEEDDDDENVFLNQVGDIAHTFSTRGGGHSLVNRRRLAKQAERQRRKQAERQAQSEEKERDQAVADANQIAKTYYVPPDLSAAEIMALMDAQLGRGRPTDVKIDNFDLNHTGLRILTNANLMLAYGRRYGLVGRNGIGKSTLMRALARRDLPIPKTMSILLVDQEVDGDDTSVLNAVLQADLYRETLLKEEKELSAQLDALQSKSGEGEKSKEDAGSLSLKLKDVYQRLEAIEADKAAPRAAAILSGLGFDLEMQERATKTFSGGWRMRVSLAKALFCKPDILLLDEPTNMLDVPAVIWLERYLQNWPSTLLIVSHDRTFLNEVVTDILHHQNEQLVHYKGDFNNFVGTRAERQKNALREYESQKQYRDHLQDFIDRWRYNANRAALAQSKIKILEKLPPLLKPTEDAPIVFRWPEPEGLSPPILQMDHVTFGYSPDKIILRDIDFDMLMTSRLAIIGPNGAGKSTMIKLLTGTLTPLEGMIHRNAKLRIAVFSQHHIDQLDLRSNSVQFLAKMFPGMPDEEYRRQLGAFGITGTTSLQKIATLSGGQRSRVAFAMMSLMRPQILIFDEPTNFLDLDSIEALIESLKDFKGGVVVISHDERFISSVCEDIWLVNEQHAGKLYCTLAEYKKSFVKELEEKIAAMERNTANLV